MKNITKQTLAGVLLSLVILLSGCTFGQAAAPTPTPVDVNAVMTSAAAAAFEQLTQIAQQATATLVPTQTTAPTLAPAASEGTPTVTISIQISETPSLTLGGATPTLLATLPVLPGATLTPIPSFTPAGSNVVSNEPVCKDSIFLEDMTVADYTVFAPWDKFYKVWRMQNTGTCVWDEGFYFAPWAGPPSMASANDAYRIKQATQFVQPGNSIDIGISMYAPGDAGEYTAHWSWYDDTGKGFGQSVTVVIIVQK